MVPMIIGAQGDGKSTFCKLLLPEELRNYYTDRLDFTNKNEAEKALSRFCLINIDEYDSITKRQTAFLKHILQKTSVMSRQLYSSVIKDNTRYSAFIATTNDPTPLTDPSGSRRYMCIKTIGKIDTRTPYDYDQIYAQLRTELQQGAKSWFDAEEETKIQKENRDFEQYDILQEVFNELFHKPKGSEKGIFITVSGILHKMHARYKSLKEDTSTYQRLGRYLKRQNYKNQKRRIGSEYYVAQNE
jgi:predicted P-loop ATPase